MEHSTRSTRDLLRLVFGKRLAGKVGDDFGTPLRKLGTLGVSDLVATYGITPRAALKLSAAAELARRYNVEPLTPGTKFLGGGEVFRHYHATMRDLKVEQFHVVLLDGKHRFMSDVLVSQGTLTSSPVHPREVFKQAISRSAAAIILVHNHPSGDPSPSADDLEITQRLVQIGNLVGIRVLDHVIVGDGVYVSLADRGLLS